MNADESINDESAREARWGVERAQRSTQQDQQETTVQGERERENQDEQSSRYELWHDAAFTLATLLSLDEPPEELLELLRRDLTAQPAHLEENAATLQDPAHQILAHQALNHDLPTTELPSSPEEIARARAAQLSEQFGQITGPYGASRYLAWDDKPSRPQPLAASLVASSTASRDISELIGEPPPDSPKIGARFTQRRRKRRLAKVRAHYQDHAST